MGLSSKQVSSSGLDNWNKALLQPPPAMRKQQQQQNQPSESLKCPRCDSTNTKFCYYNNYNKSQPRHFCRTCKRHWTKGGTLRNVPVGGGRKNKRMKKSATSTSSSAATPVTTSSSTVTTSIGNLDGGVNIHVANIQSPHQQLKKNLPLAVNDQKNVPSFFQSVIRPPSLMPPQNLVNTREMETKDFGTGNGLFLGSSFSLAQNQGLHFPFSTSSSFEPNPSSVPASLRSSSSVYNYVEEFKPLMEEASMNSALLPSTSGSKTQPWEMPPPAGAGAGAGAAAATSGAAAATSGAMEMSNYWNWEDIDSLVSSDQNLSWPEDSDIKP